MKRILTYLLVITIIILNACKEDGEPKTVPTVTTNAPTDITTTSATVGGNITSTGNDEIIESGVVYSKNVAEPTIADNKVAVTVAKGVFSGSLTGLTSGTTYHVRAFATNNVGTAYGDVIDLSTGNSAPVVTNVSIDGPMEVNKTVTATYTYADAENDTEGATTFQWYIAEDAAGTGDMAIEGAIEKTLLIQEAQNQKYLRVAVTPVATAGTITGETVKSLFMGEVGEATTVTFMYNGVEVIYGIITSTTTQRKWLDRNLGALQIAESVNDYKAFGDLFQWGRLADGHQLITRLSSSSGSGDTGITSTTAPYETSSEDVPTTNKFIIDKGPKGEWRDPQKNDLWQDFSGINNPCPSGWIVPTKDEWNAEAISSGPDGYAKLKLTYTGFRDVTSGNVVYTDWGFYWSSTIDETYAPLMYSINIGFDASIYFADISNRGNGEACRCIKE